VDFTLTSPGALWLLLAALPLLWVGLRLARTNFSRPQRVVQTAVRFLLLASLALALAGPVVARSTSGLSIVYLVDVSHSIGTAAIREAADRIDQLTDELTPETATLVAFGADARVIKNTAALRAQAASAETPEWPMRTGTNLDAALGAARAEFETGRSPRIVLFTDGRETSGDAREAAVRLAAAGVPVFIEPMAVRNLGDVWIDDVSVPERVLAGALARFTVSVASQRDGPAIVELREGPALLASTRVTLTRGTQAIVLDWAFEAPGTRVVDAIVRAEGDTLAQNNTLAREVVVEPRSRVLYVEGAVASARYLSDALRHAGFEVTVRPPAQLPASAEALQGWDVVILSDVARASIADETMAALAAWVERDGGGLLMAGGANVFGVGSSGGTAGYRDTELERLMPVTFERDDEPEVALVIVFDKSWSMAGTVLALCKAAAQAAIDVLDDEHLVGVITFNDKNSWDVTVRQVGPNRQAIRQAVGAIEASGYTMIYPAIEQAYEALLQTNARAKHVVLLSDGRSGQQDYEGLVRKMVDAKMTVSSVAVGPGADAELLTDIARWGKGRSYVVQDPKQVSQIFVTEAKTASTPAFDEGSALKPIVTMPGFLRGVDLTGMPVLHGRTATVLKDEALQIIATADDDPLLAMWPAGLGRTAVFTSDVKDRWARDWVRWRGYGPFFAALVHAIERPRPPAFEVTSRLLPGDVRSIVIGLERRTGAGAYLNLDAPSVSVQSGTEQAAASTARQVSPGRYEARLMAPAAERLTITASTPDGTTASRAIVPDLQAEYRFRAPDLPLLESVATVTGGHVSADASRIRSTGAVAPARRRALWPALVLIALGLWFIDIVLRRVRFGERPAGR
jgi:uncharacterized membrane protein